MTTLTRAEARTRAASVRVRAYDLQVDLTGGAQRFGSRSTISFDSTDGAATFVDVDPATLDAVRLNGAPVDPARFDAAARRLPIRPRIGENVLVVDATMRYSTDGEGMHRHVDPVDGRAYLYAMSFLDAAPRWFACFDQPDLKAPVSIDVQCPPDWVVLGNGPVATVSPGHWLVEPTKPLATYFTTLVAGPYHQVWSEHDGIRLGLHVRRSLRAELDRDAPELFAHTARCLDELHRLFGVRYPWGEYHQAFVPDLTDSAMENPGCVTLGDTYIFRSQSTESERIERAVTMAHEMAHMWFGDLVTMRWWDDLWLNESFAEYLGTRITGPQCWVHFGASRKSWGYAADRRPSTHPVAGNGAADAAAALTDFDGISYAKGASVLRQLELHAGAEVFLNGLRSYIRTHQYGNAELQDLLSEWTAAGARDLPAWATAWLRTTGLDELRVGTDSGGAALHRHSADGTPREHTLTVAAYAADGTELTSQDVRVRSDSTPLQPVRGAALVLPDARDETWAKLVLGAQDWAAVPALLPTIADARARVALWNALRLAVDDAEVSPRLALDTVLAALPHEPDDGILAGVGEWARRTLCGRYLADADRDTGLAGLADALSPVVAVAGSRQLAAARVLAAASPDAGVLRSWLTGAGLPRGLDLDAELRWTVLDRLARLGAIDGAQLEAEAASDRSSAGLVHAARCRAARPDAAAKAAAWQTIVGDANRPVQELYATAEGFWQPGQDELLRPYVDRYADGIAATAALRSGWVVQRIASLAFPSTIVAATTLAAADRVLATADLDHGIRRAVVDVRDDLRRAVEVRRRYP